MTTRDERAARADFAERYAVATSDVNHRIEMGAIGAVWGANGYTTRDQADELGRQLRLDPRARVLEVGVGRGWPSLYLVATTGCTAVGTDMPLEGLRIARDRARTEGIEDRASMIAAAGDAQPFRAASFDAIVLSDVLC